MKGFARFTVESACSVDSKNEVSSVRKTTAKADTHKVIRSTSRRQDGQVGIVEKTSFETGKRSVEVESHESLSQRRSRSRSIDCMVEDVSREEGERSRESRETHILKS